MFENFKNKLKLKKIEKVLGYRLYDWQRNYILGKSSVLLPGSKLGYKIIAEDLRFFMYSQDPVVTINSRVLSLYTESLKSYIFKKGHYNRMKKLYYKLTMNGIELRPIKFIDEVKKPSEPSKTSKD